MRRRSAPAQVAILDRLRPAYAVTLDQLASGAVEPELVEIGCGAGEATLSMATGDPRRLLAAEVHTPGVAALLAGLEAHGLTHVQLLEGDGRDALARLPPESLSEVRVFFPDPWPKTRHVKRRLVTPSFVALVAGRLRPGGQLHVATDWPAYAVQMLDVVEGSDAMEVVSRSRGDRPVTRFERRGLTAGRPAIDLVARRITGSAAGEHGP